LPQYTTCTLREAGTPGQVKQEIRWKPPPADEEEDDEDARRPYELKLERAPQPPP
jgi:hypothetical protein